MCLTCPAPAAAGGAQPDADTAGVGIQLLDAPVNRRDDPRALRYIVDHLRPGTVIERDVLVVNRSESRQTIELYPAAATIDGGRFRFDEGRTANDLASWVSVDRTRLDLEPGASAALTATVAVPPTASSGERYAVLWASTVAGAEQAQVRQIHRVGIRLYVDVGPGGEAATSFELGGVLPSRDGDGVPSAAVDVTNTGGRAVDLTGSAVLSEGPGKLETGPFDVVKGTTLGPGQSGTVTVLFPNEVPDGPWTITVDLESGTATGSVTARITFPPPGQAGRPGSGVDSPWLLAGLVVPLAAGLFLVGRHLRRTATSAVPARKGRTGAPSFD